MSSKLLRKDRADGALPIVWRRVGSAADGGADSAQSDAATPPAPDVLQLEGRLRSLQAEMQIRVAQATEEALARGATEAQQQLEGPVREAIERLARELAQLASLGERLRRDAEEDLVRLAIEIARRILRREIATDPAAVLGLAKAALERLAAREILRVRVTPSDVALLQRHLAEQGMPDRIEVTGDANLERGAVIVETSRGDLDASVETQLQEIERGFTDLIRRRH